MGSRNRWRSPTAGKIFDGVDYCSARSAGHLGWADVLFVMEQKHRRPRREKFPEELADKPVHCLHIPDDYRFRQPELVDLRLSACAKINSDLPSEGEYSSTPASRGA